MQLCLWEDKSFNGYGCAFGKHLGKLVSSASLHTRSLHPLDRMTTVCARMLVDSTNQFPRHMHHSYVCAVCILRSEMKMHDGHPGSLGSSTPLLGHPAGCGCMNTVPGGLADDCNCIYMPYLGASHCISAFRFIARVFVRTRPSLHTHGLRQTDCSDHQHS